MWRVARAAHHDEDDDTAALFPDAVDDADEARDGLPKEPHPREQLEEAVWYEVMHNKATEKWGRYPLVMTNSSLLKITIFSVFYISFFH